MRTLDELPGDVVARLREVSLVVSDVDGVLTDGAVLLLSSGEEGRAFNMKDGLGVRLLRAADVAVAWLSAAADTGVVRARAERLGVDLVDLGEGDKGARFDAIVARLGAQAERTLYLGDDVNDLPAMRRAGLSACPADAAPLVRQAATFALSLPGGAGAFREAVELILAARDAPRTL